MVERKEKGHLEPKVIRNPQPEVILEPSPSHSHHKVFSLSHSYEMTILIEY